MGPETCNGIDDDCDGRIDEEIAPQPTQCGAGTCEGFGELVCEGGELVDTRVPDAPEPEVCDGLDNDCDGIVDGDVCDAGGLSCLELNECFGGCPADEIACFEQCFADATPDAQQQYQALSACYEQNCLGAGDANACLFELCGAEIDACIGGPPPPPPPPPGGMTCAEMVGCFNGCAPDDQACVQGCFDASTPEAQQQYIEIIGCFEANDCANADDPNACVNERCVEQIQACLEAPPPPPPPADLSCSELVDCFGTCGPDDQACLQGCFDAATPDAQQQYADIIACYEANQCEQSADPGQCVNELCAEQIQICFDAPPPPPPPGDLSCPDLFGCFDGCGDDQACLEGCLQSASPEAQDQYFAIAACYQVNECELSADPTACVNERCGPELQACFAGPPPPPAYLTCAEMVDCFNGCPAEDPACPQACFDASTPEAQQGYLEILGCYDANDCANAADPDACINELCAAEIQACLAPPPPPPPPGSTCADALNCALGCGGDLFCVGACVDGVADEERFLADAALQCAVQSGCDLADVACVQAECAAEVQACLAGAQPSCEDQCFQQADQLFPACLDGAVPAVPDGDPLACEELVYGQFVPECIAGCGG